VRILSHKYIKVGDIWSIKAKGNISLIWRSILKTLEALRQGFQFCITDGSSSFWYDNWTGLGALCHLVDFGNILDTKLQLKDFSFITSWDWNKLMTMVSNELNTIVYQFPLLWPLMIIFRIDEFGELLKKKGILTLHYRELNANESWDLIWKLSIPANVQHFLWLCMHNVISINKFQHHCNLVTSHICQRYGTHDEDELYCLMDCAPSKEVWQQICSVNHPYFFNFTSLKT